MPPSTLPVPAKRVLPPKESTLFRELLTLYETRQLKKALKTADQILKKHPEHGETLCMKGLVQTHLGKRDEGLELVKKGVRLDLTSHIVWHVFGLIQKGEKNYEEALKSYTQALRFDKENMNILRDAAHLQTQLRHFDALIDTRHLLLKLRPNMRQNWIALAVAYTLNRNFSEAKKVLEMYERSLKNIPDYDFEHSELLLFHVHVLEELGEWSEALSILDTNAKDRTIVDRVAIMETRARLLSKSGSQDAAEQAWRDLIQHNPDNYDHYRGLLLSKGVDLDVITASNRTEALQILQDISDLIPRADTPSRLALTASEGDEFRTLVRAYILRGLKKGIPSLFADIKSLYRDTQKQTTIEELVEGFRETQEKGDSLDGESSSDPSSSVASPADPEEPTTYLWTLYFLAQHHSSLGRHSRAVDLLDVALQHTPTLPELHLFKGRVLKRLGDPYGATTWVDSARLLDGQDRFLNTKSAKYRLRAGLVEEANNMLGMFTKKDAPSPGADLEDMQSLLYLIEEGDAHRRSGKLHLALKKYHAVQKVFDEIEDDQFDFHGYSMRKFTLNIYLNLLSWEDKVRAHPGYVSSAISASRIYVRVYDDPTVAKNCVATDTLNAKKKAKAIAKAKKATQKIQETQKAAASTNEDKGLEIGPAKDDDPDGIKLLTDPEPLERAWKLLSPLTTAAKDNIDVWIQVYDVAVRRGKYLQAVRALNTAKALDAENPQLHVRLIHFRKTHSSLSTPLPNPVGALVSEALASLLPTEVSSEAFNSNYLQSHPSNPHAILASAEALRILDNPREDVENAVFGALNPDVDLKVKSALDILTFLRELHSPRVEEFMLACDAKFELSTVFKSPAEQEALAKKGSADAKTEVATDAEKEVAS